MKIADSTLQMASKHLMAQHYEASESLRAWNGRRPPADLGSLGTPRELVQLSDTGKAAQSAEAQAIDESKEAVEKDPRIQLIKTVIEFLTGKTVKTLDPRELQTTQQTSTEATATIQASGTSGYGMDYQRHESYAEYERTTFAASGIVHTTDGQEISFKLDLTLERAFRLESDTHIQQGEAAHPKDPLVINFGGTSAQLADTAFRFDLNADGRMDQLKQLLSGSGFLALDRNKDGKINNGKELFGPTSGNGFTELARLDDDHNGWIDENDSAWQQLKVWTPDAKGQGTLQSLKDANVGAISLQTQATPFALKNSANELLGQVVASSVFLKESGGAGSVQQVDLIA